MIIDYRTYPRISGSLRAHSSIAEKLHYRGNIDELQRRREKLSNNQPTETFSWSELQSFLLKNSSSSVALEPLLKELRKNAIEFGSFIRFQSFLTLVKFVVFCSLFQLVPSWIRRRSILFAFICLIFFDRLKNFKFHI